MLKQYLIAAAFGTCGFFLGTAMANANSVLGCLSVSTILGPPDEPACVRWQYGPFEDSDSYDRCRREVEAYVEELANWRQCLAEDAIEKFNRRARG